MLNIFPNVDKNMLYYILLVLEGNLGVTGKVLVIWSGGSRVQALENLYQKYKFRLRTIDPCDLALSWILRIAKTLVHQPFTIICELRILLNPISLIYHYYYYYYPCEFNYYSDQSHQPTSKDD